MKPAAMPSLSLNRDPELSRAAGDEWLSVSKIARPCGRRCYTVKFPVKREFSANARITAGEGLPGILQDARDDRRTTGLGTRKGA